MGDKADRGPAREQTVIALVENKAGVLARVVGLFARRGFNISSLAVAPTEDERFSRITFVYDTNSVSVDQVVNQVNKLVNVISIEPLDRDKSVERELLLATINADAANRQEVIELVQIFKGNVIDVGHEAVTVSIAGRPSKLDDFEDLVEPYGICSLQRTGRVALPVLSRKNEKLFAVNAQARHA